MKAKKCKFVILKNSKLKLMKLEVLKQNKKAIIVNTQNASLPLKLLEMGFIDGVEIEYLFKAPSGSPLYYKIGNTRIALGKEIISEIEVELIHS